MHRAKSKIYRCELCDRRIKAQDAEAQTPEGKGSCLHKLLLTASGGAAARQAHCEQREFRRLAGQLLSRKKIFTLLNVSTQHAQAPGTHHAELLLVRAQGRCCSLVYEESRARQYVSL